MYVYQSLNGLPFAYRHVRISDIPTGIVDVSVNVCVTVQQ